MPLKKEYHFKCAPWEASYPCHSIQDGIFIYILSKQQIYGMSNASCHIKANKYLVEM